MQAASRAPPALEAALARVRVELAGFAGADLAELDAAIAQVRAEWARGPRAAPASRPAAPPLGAALQQAHAVAPAGPAPPAAARQGAPAARLCAGCGDPLEDGQWQLEFLASGTSYHYDCFQDPVDPDKDGRIRALRRERRVLATLPADDLFALSTHLKEVRREQRADRARVAKLDAEARALRAEQAGCAARKSALGEAPGDARGDARGDGDSALRRQLRKQLAQLRRASRHCAFLKLKLRRLQARTVAALDQPQLRRLRNELARALRTVDRVRAERARRCAAEKAVQAEHPHFCCPVELTLMKDPVATDDGRTFERKAIEQWFHTLARQDAPITSPLRAPLESTRLVPNHNLRLAISAAVDKQLKELRELSEAARAAGSKRSRAGE